VKCIVIGDTHKKLYACISVISRNRRRGAGAGVGSGSELRERGCRCHIDVTKIDITPVLCPGVAVWGVCKKKASNSIW